MADRPLTSARLSLTARAALLSALLVIAVMAVWTTVSRTLLWPSGHRLVEQTGLERTLSNIALGLESALCPASSTPAAPSLDRLPLLLAPYLERNRLPPSALTVVEGSEAAAILRSPTSIPSGLEPLRLATPLCPSAPQPLALRLEVPPEYLSTFAPPGAQHRIVLTGTLLALLVVGVALAISLVSMNRSLRPLRSLTEAIDAMARGNDPHPIDARHAPPDLARIAHRFNQMVQTLEERRRILEASERRYRTLFESSGDPMLLLHPENGRLEDVNPSAERLWGQTRDQLLGRPLLELLAPDPSSTDPSTTSLPKAPRAPGTRISPPPSPLEPLWSTPSGQPIRARLTRPDGRIHRLELVSIPVSLEDRPHCLITGRDLTSQLATWDQLLQTSRVNAIGLMASGVAHQLNNPLVGVLNMAQLLRQQLRPPDPNLELAEMIEEGATRCRDIVQALLRFGRRSDTTAPVPIDLQALCLELEALSGAQARKVSGTLTFHLAPDLPAVTGHPTQLAQVGVNLISNALLAAGIGARIEVHAFADRDALVLEVRDNGPGIPETARAHLFEPFFTTRAPGEGTGLGLAVADRIVRDHGGQLELVDRPGYGAVFRITLPAVRPDPSEAPDVPDNGTQPLMTAPVLS